MLQNGHQFIAGGFVNLMYFFNGFFLQPKKVFQPLVDRSIKFESKNSILLWKNYIKFRSQQKIQFHIYFRLQLESYTVEKSAKKKPLVQPCDVYFFTGICISKYYIFSRTNIYRKAAIE